MKNILVYRCKAKTEDQYRTITVDPLKRLYHCDCEGSLFTGYNSFCSHIDATLVAGERHMVPDEDRPIADKAMKVLSGTINIPFDWSGSWRRNRVWRGLGVPRGPRESHDKTSVYGEDYYERPRVCFTGKGHKPRKDLMEEARASGWQVEDSFSKSVKLLVAEDVSANSSKLRNAASQNIPVINYTDWMEMISEEWEISPA